MNDSPTTTDHMCWAVQKKEYCLNISTFDWNASATPNSICYIKFQIDDTSLSALAAMLIILKKSNPKVNMLGNVIAHRVPVYVAIATEPTLTLSGSLSSTSSMHSWTKRNTSSMHKQSGLLVPSNQIVHTTTHTHEHSHMQIKHWGMWWCQPQLCKPLVFVGSRSAVKICWKCWHGLFLPVWICNGINKVNRTALTITTASLSLAMSAFNIWIKNLSPNTRSKVWENWMRLYAHDEVSYKTPR